MDQQGVGIHLPLTEGSMQGFDHESSLQRAVQLPADDPPGEEIHPGGIKTTRLIQADQRQVSDIENWTRGDAGADGSCQTSAAQAG